MEGEEAIDYLSEAFSQSPQRPGQAEEGEDDKSDNPMSGEEFIEEPALDIDDFVRVKGDRFCPWPEN